MARCRGRTFLVTVDGEDRVQFGAGRGQRGRGALLGLESCRIGGRRFANDPPEHEQFDEGVPAEAIRPVQAAGRFADGVQALHARPVVLGAHPDTTHRVVRGRCDLARRRSDVEHLQIQERLIDAG